jgi:glycosyltransferase involved in cell wall biosynthesis
MRQPKADRKLNLLIVVAGLGVGGAEVVIQHLVQAIDRSRFNVTICCIKIRGVIGDRLASEGIDIISLADPDEAKVDYFAFVKLLKVIRERKIDVVHTHTLDALADAAVCRMMLRRMKLIHTFHFGNYPHITKRRKWMESIFSKAADRLIAVGEVQRQTLRAIYKFPDSRISRVWNGVTSPQTDHDDSFRAQIGTKDRVLVGTISTLIEQKGLQDFLTVASRFRAERDKVLFVVVGEGHLGPQLESMRDQLQLQDTVVFAGLVPNAAQVALPAFDIFFQSSLWEAMSIAILEAMAAAKPILATSVGENPYIIEDGVDGLLVEPQDVNSMTAALRRLIDDAELRKRIGNSAYKKFTRQFTVQHMTRAYEDIYHMQESQVQAR